MSDALLEAVRNAIGLEVEWHNTHAVRLEQWAKHAFSPTLSKQLNAAAFGCRQRAEMLSAVLAASEPSTEGIAK
jgi:hypothetical protein